jgi:hypothetical protein
MKGNIDATRVPDLLNRTHCRNVGEEVDGVWTLHGLFREVF